MWYKPGPSFGYTLKKIDEHPWETLLTMKEIVKLEPASIEFCGTEADAHTEFWEKEYPHFFAEKKSPHFVIDTTPMHPHRVETKPRRPFKPWER